MPADFTLPTATGAPMTFDAPFREQGLSLLFFYRGYW